MVAHSNTASTVELAQYLVCGLGSLGQYCVAALKAFGAKISAIELVQPRTWEVQNLPDLLECLVIGDCRQPNVLHQTKIQQCRAALLVTNNERINIEAAFAIRLLNPTVRLVVRSAERNLNQLLEQQLGNFTALEMTALPAPALAIAALANETKGLITLDNQLLRVVHCPIDSTHRWCDLRLVHELNSRTRRVLSHCPAAATLPTQFYQWEPEARIRAGDSVTYIEIIQGLGDFRSASTTSSKSKKTIGDHWRGLFKQQSSIELRQIPAQLWQLILQQQTKRVAILVSITVLTLILLNPV
jgi:TrkA-N domain